MTARPRSTVRLPCRSPCATTATGCRGSRRATSVAVMQRRRLARDSRRSPSAGTARRPRPCSCGSSSPSRRAVCAMNTSSRVVVPAKAVRARPASTNTWTCGVPGSSAKLSATARSAGIGALGVAASPRPMPIRMYARSSSRSRGAGNGRCLPLRRTRSMSAPDRRARAPSACQSSCAIASLRRCPAAPTPPCRSAARGSPRASGARSSRVACTWVPRDALPSTTWFRRTSSADASSMPHGRCAARARGSTRCAARGASCASASSPAERRAACARSTSRRSRTRRATALAGRRALAGAVRVHAQPHAARAGRRRRRAPSRSSSTRPIRSARRRRRTSRGSRSATARPRAACSRRSTRRSSQRSPAGASRPRRSTTSRSITCTSRTCAACSRRAPAAARSCRTRSCSCRQAELDTLAQHPSAAGRVVHPRVPRPACRPIGSSRSTATTRSAAASRSCARPATRWGNHSLVVVTDRGAWTISENGVCVDAYAPGMSAHPRRRAPRARCGRRGDPQREHARGLARSVHVDGAREDARRRRARSPGAAAALLVDRAGAARARARARADATRTARSRTAKIANASVAERAIA